MKPEVRPVLSYHRRAAAVVVLILFAATFFTGVVTERHVLATSRAAPVMPTGSRAIEPAQTQLRTLRVDRSLAVSLEVMSRAQLAEAYVVPTPRAPVRRSADRGSAVAGVATWYDVGSGVYAAAKRGIAAKGDRVVVCREQPFHCLVIPVVDVCACGDRNGRHTLLDLSPDAFAELAPLSRGVVLIRVETLR
jgi:rare lipoprotein A (peptidoglycan hydrolase)